MRPMLAYKLKPSDKLVYPLWVQPKLDGIRVLLKPTTYINSTVLTRSLKVVPNKHIRRVLSEIPFQFDGEVVAGSFNETQSAVMSVDGEPDFKYHVFDVWSDSDAPFTARYAKVRKEVLHLDHPNIVFVDTAKVSNEKELLEREELYLYQGYEGLIIRRDRRYKYGRSTFNNGELFALKRFVDDEAQVVGATCWKESVSTSEYNELGLLQKTTHQGNDLNVDALGCLHVVHPTYGEFAIGTGFNWQQRVDLWQESLIGKTVKFKYFAHGMKDKPRHPVFLGFRSPLDM